ncbi:MFS transporter [Raineyella sp. W15-4]|uniref:MFS transporter n=1 Tax=Raineyella sp. W15-4 TaxID=3081651 RepID=UPI00295494A3|nr:MFS transporter [Raineyella sp. W15-4]WOQ17571.1 MFS transporter [Raineyella sp. W15-4]
MSAVNQLKIDKASPEVVAAALKKVTTRLIPFLLLMYVIAFLDRTNLGWAQAKWHADYGISTMAYTFGATLFFIGYAVFEVPSNLIMHRVGARWWMTRIMVSWGLVAICFMFVRGVASFYTLRFLLGVAEAGFFPGVMLYLTYWYPAARRAWASGLFYMGLPIANMIGNPLSGGLLELDGTARLSGVQWMFLVEGGVAVLVGILCPYFLVDRPDRARWLTSTEKAHLSRQIEIEEAAKETAKPISWKQAIIDPRILYFCLIYFCIQGSVYGLTFFLPKQVTTMTGQSAGLMASLVTAIPWSIALVGVIILPRLADKSLKYKSFLAILMLCSGLGIGASGLFLHSSKPALVALSIAAVGFVSAQPIFWQLPTRYLSGAALAGATGLINAIGNLGGWLAPNLRTWAAEKVWGTTAAPNEAAGLFILGIAGLLGFALVLGLKLFHQSDAENRAAAIQNEASAAAH